MTMAFEMATVLLNLPPDLAPYLVMGKSLSGKMYSLMVSIGNGASTTIDLYLSFPEITIAIITKPMAKIVFFNFFIR